MPQTTDGVQFHKEVGLGWHIQGTVCLGFGSSFCKDAVETEGHIGTRLVVAKKWTDEDTFSNSAKLTYSYKYTTSNALESTGRNADMFLTPSLNVKFSISDQITFDASTCAGSSKSITTWSLDSDSNVPVCHS
jgi:hypothetical protein